MKITKIFAIATIAILLQIMVVSTSFAATPEYGYGPCGSSDSGVYHTVHYGETLFSIGRCYDVYPYAIAEANGLWNPDYIYAGQIIYIPDGPPYQRNTGCGYNDCNWQDNTGCGYNDCNWQEDNTGCGYDDCNWQEDNTGYNYGYGYDRSGYYYDANYPGTNYGRYSYPCGYEYNCY